MMLHLLKMVWNRKRMNSLIVLEIFVSFIVLFWIFAVSVHYYNNYRLPLGYSCRNVWMIRANPTPDTGELYVQADPALMEKYRQVLLMLRGLAEVEEVAAAVDAPYDRRDWNWDLDLDGRRVNTRVNEVSDEFKDVMNLQLVGGRWFQPEDDALSWIPVVINKKLARMAFGDKDPVGIRISQDPQMRIVGVISEFRKDGEYSTPKPYMFLRSLSKSAPDILRTIVIKLAPETPRSFEEQLVSNLQRVAKKWSFEIQPLEEVRESHLNTTVLPMKMMALVDVFLMIMLPTRIPAFSPIALAIKKGWRCKLA